MCTYEKKGTLTVYQHKDEPKALSRRGGSVVSYVCTPAGEVLHAILANPDSESYADDLTWALELYAALEEVSSAGRTARAGEAHAKKSALSRPLRDILTTNPLAPIGRIERQVFEQVLGQTWAPERPIDIKPVDQLPSRGC